MDSFESALFFICQNLNPSIGSVDKSQFELYVSEEK